MCSETVDSCELMRSNGKQEVTIPSGQDRLVCRKNEESQVSQNSGSKLSPISGSLLAVGPGGFWSLNRSFKSKVEVRRRERDGQVSLFEEFEGRSQQILLLLFFLVLLFASSRFKTSATLLISSHGYL